MPHCPPLAVHTRWRTFNASWEYFRALALGSDLRRPGGSLAADTRRRRALSWLQPVTAQTSPEDPPPVLLRRLRVRPSVPVCNISPGLHQATHFPCPPRSTSFAGSPTRGTEPLTRASFMSVVGPWTRKLPYDTINSLNPHTSWAKEALATELCARKELSRHVNDRADHANRPGFNYRHDASK